jgi:hypothetical protein
VSVSTRTIVASNTSTGLSAGPLVAALVERELDPVCGDAADLHVREL